MSVRERLLIAGWLTTFVVGTFAFLFVQTANSSKSDVDPLTANQVNQLPTPFIEPNDARAQLPAVQQPVSAHVTAPTAILGPTNAAANPVVSVTNSDSTPGSNPVAQARIPEQKKSSAEDTVATPAVTPEPTVPVPTAPATAVPDITSPTPEPEIVYVFPDGSAAPAPNTMTLDPLPTTQSSYDDDEYEEHESEDDDDHHGYYDDDDDHERHDDHESHEREEHDDD